MNYALILIGVGMGLLIEASVDDAWESRIGNGYFPFPAFALFGILVILFGVVFLLFSRYSDRQE